MIILMMILFKAIKRDDVPPVAILNYQRVYHGISLAIKDVFFSHAETWGFKQENLGFHLAKWGFIVGSMKDLVIKI